MPSVFDLEPQLFFIYNTTVVTPTAVKKLNSRIFGIDNNSNHHVWGRKIYYVAVLPVHAKCSSCLLKSLLVLSVNRKRLLCTPYTRRHILPMFSSPSSDYMDDQIANYFILHLYYSALVGMICNSDDACYHEYVISANNSWCVWLRVYVNNLDLTPQPSLLGIPSSIISIRMNRHENLLRHALYSSNFTSSFSLPGRFSRISLPLDIVPNDATTCSGAEFFDCDSYLLIAAKGFQIYIQVYHGVG